MFSRIGSRLTYANVVATLALFIALGGGAYAAVKLPANSVNTKQIKDRAVTKAKLAPGVALSGLKGDTGPQGLKGDTGPQGDPGVKGDTGTPGATKITARYGQTSNQTVAAGGVETAVASCNPGEVAVGGGGFTNAPNFVLYDSYSLGSSPSGWQVYWRNPTAGSVLNTVSVEVLCASP
jgi:hypothetical protein